MLGVVADGPDRRRPGWLAEGEDPDYRFSLANERTFLAWIRTALALLAAAVALVQLVPPFGVQGARTGIGVLLAVLGLLVAVLAYARWARNERAMRTGAPLPHTPLLRVLSGALALIAVVVVVLIIVGST